MNPNHYNPHYIQTFKLTDQDQTISFGEIIGQLAYPNLVIAFDGDLGAGKTTMTKGIAIGLKIDDNVNSPTFTIMKIYQGRLVLYHLDVYRVESAADDFELEEYFYLGGVSVIEWASRIKPLIPDDALRIKITVNDQDQRLVEITTNNQEFFNNLREKGSNYLC